MKIEKSGDTPGMWNAICWIKGISANEFFVACSTNKVEALDRLFEKLYWVMNLTPQQ
jgi:hypothetical protein